MASADFAKDSDVFHKCNPETCICGDHLSCHSVFCYQLQCFGLTSIIDDPRCLFHVQQEKPIVGEPFNEHFDILAIYSVNNTLLTNQYNPLLILLLVMPMKKLCIMLLKPTLQV